MFSKFEKCSIVKKRIFFFVYYVSMFNFQKEELYSKEIANKLQKEVPNFFKLIFNIRKIKED